MRRVARALLRATSGPAGVPTSTAGWPSVSCRSFAGAAPRRSGGDWALSAVERSAAALQGLNVADDGEEEEEEEDESPLFYGSADGRDNSSTSRRLHEQREAEEEAASARMHGLRVVQSTLLFPPSAEALANLPELARLTAQQAEHASAAGQAEAKVARVRAFAQRVMERIQSRLPLTAHPSLTRSLLQNNSTVVELQSDWEYFHLVPTGEEGKRELADAVLAECLECPEAFGPRESKRVTGLPLPWHLAPARRLTQASAATTGAQAPNLRDALRERKAYTRVVQPHAVAHMLLAAHAERVTIIQVQSACTWADAFVIATARSHAHLRALAGAALHFFSNARAAAITAGDPQAAALRPSVEGSRTAAESPEWLVVDMDSVVVHLFTQDMRAAYALEELWGEEHGCPVEYVEADVERLEAHGGSSDGDVSPSSDGDVSPSEEAWQPIVFDRRQRRFRSFQERDVAQEPLLSELLIDAQPDEQLDEKLARYEAAARKLTAREALREASMERVAAAKTEKLRLVGVQRDVKLKANAQSRAEKGTPESTPHKSVRTRLLRQALERGLEYDTEAQPNPHAPGCACHACAFVRKSVLSLGVPEKGDQGAAQEACPPRCACTDCQWVRWRSRHYAKSSERAALAAGVTRPPKARRRKGADDSAAVDS